VGRHLSGGGCSGGGNGKWRCDRWISMEKGRREEIILNIVDDEKELDWIAFGDGKKEHKSLPVHIHCCRSSQSS